MARTVYKRREWGTGHCLHWRSRGLELKRQVENMGLHVSIVRELGIIALPIKFINRPVQKQWIGNRNSLQKGAGTSDTPSQTKEGVVCK